MSCVHMRVGGLKAGTARRRHGRRRDEQTENWRYPMNTASASAEALATATTLPSPLGSGGGGGGISGRGAFLEEMLRHSVCRGTVRNSERQCCIVSAAAQLLAKPAIATHLWYVLSRTLQNKLKARCSVEK